jgi:hypothetical protein
VPVRILHALRHGSLSDAPHKAVVESRPARPASAAGGTAEQFAVLCLTLCPTLNRRCMATMLILNTVADVSWAGGTASRQNQGLGGMQTEHGRRAILIRGTDAV